ncbi:hypothetical protein BDQ12DRAFT_678466 [Crucibulum laeve]|uniref:Shikimate dehydrogenase substrate binding N-terminal domain-containing protein n=1 Tax=Crucibulum laeve TaxID=68775 RepID=A0A5C3MAX6_9AGAR|nr:hypothetical protein BDQ12DRAFT_678466 [Crucibulum laeve]
MLEVLASDECGGAAITMPLKSAILPFLDEVSPESKATGACNTVVKVPLGVWEEADGRKRWKLVGTNTDILGVRNALLLALSSQLSSPSSLPPTPRISGSALLIGGGATTRSAAYALTLLSLSPLYIINRDEAEVKAVVESMPGVQFIHLATVDDVQRYLSGKGREIVMGVGAIPAIPPQTPAERAVYEIAGAVFSLPYDSESASTTIPSENGIRPQKRIYLEMAVRPSPSPLA